MTIGTTELLQNVPVLGAPSTFAVTTYSEQDIPKFQKYFQQWQLLRDASLEINSRIPNLGEAFTEGVFCLWHKSSRYAKPSSVSLDYTENLLCKCLDTYNVQGQQAEQIKASISEEDCTSFGPNSKEDVMYFMSFWNNGVIDGTFNVYQIPLDKLHSTIVNKGKQETFEDQCKQGRRPRLSLLTEVIKPLGIKPCGQNIRLW